MLGMHEVVVAGGSKISAMTLAVALGEAAVIAAHQPAVMQITLARRDVCSVGGPRRAVPLCWFLPRDDQREAA
jgi:hypothetical protein